MLGTSTFVCDGWLHRQIETELLNRDYHESRIQSLFDVVKPALGEMQARHRFQPRKDDGRSASGKARGCLKWWLRKVAAHMWVLRLLQFVLAITINGVINWTYVATPSLRQYSMTGFGNQSAQAVPEAVLTSTAYQGLPKADDAVRGLGIVLAIVSFILLLRVYISSKMILAQRYGGNARAHSRIDRLLMWMQCAIAAPCRRRNVALLLQANEALVRKLGAVRWIPETAYASFLFLFVFLRTLLGRPEGAGNADTARFDYHARKFPWLRAKWFGVLLIVTSFSALSHVAYLGLAIAGVWYPLLYSAHLFVIVSISPVLRGIVHAIMDTWRQLGLVAMLAVFIVYCYAVVSFVYFRQYIVTENFEYACNSLAACFYFSLQSGLGSGAGVGQLGADFVPLVDPSDSYVNQVRRLDTVTCNHDISEYNRSASRRKPATLGCLPSFEFDSPLMFGVVLADDL